MSCHLIRIALLLVLPCAMVATSSAQSSAKAHTPKERWILIESASATLSVMRGNTIETKFEDISLGRRGIKPLHFAGDNSTPSGEFHINATNPDSTYTLFFQLNYPTLVHASKALEQGRITQPQFDQIKLAEQQGRTPPHNTPLGGMIGIHGIGSGSLEVHQDYNWTEGCVALDNQQILQLAPLVHLGMRVVIQ